MISRLYFGQNTTWYLHIHLVCARLFVWFAIHFTFLCAIGLNFLIVLRKVLFCITFFAHPHSGWLFVSLRSTALRHSRIVAGDVISKRSYKQAKLLRNCTSSIWCRQLFARWSGYTHSLQLYPPYSIAFIAPKYFWDDESGCVLPSHRIKTAQ